MTGRDTFGHVEHSTEEKVNAAPRLIALHHTPGVLIASANQPLRVTTLHFGPPPPLSTKPYDSPLSPLTTSQQFFMRMVAEGTVVGIVFAFWWRASCNADKEKVNKYYQQLRREVALQGGEE